MKTLGITMALFAMTLALGLSSGCKPKGTTGNTDSTASDTIFVDPSPECEGLMEKQFCWQGLDFIRLKDSLIWKTFPAPAGGVFKDTVFSDTVKFESDVQITDWNVRMLTFATGKVLLEADFESGFFLNRIQIATPEYRMKNGLGVGSTVADVAKAYDGEQIQVTPFEEYGVMEVIRTLIIGADRRILTFHIPLGEWYERGTAYTMANIPQDAKITRVVVM